MFMGPRNWLQEMNSANLCSLAGQYDNPLPPRFLAPIDFLKIPALVTGGVGRRLAAIGYIYRRPIGVNNLDCKAECAVN
jgi:hypothetical protein